MAPKGKGGGGGSSSSSGSSFDNECADNDAFSNSYAIAEIAILGVILFLFLLLAYLVNKRSTKRKKANESKGILRWYHYGIAMFFALAYFILSTTHYALVECRIISSALDNGALATATFIAGFLSEYWLLAVVLFVVINKMLLLGGSKAIRWTLKIIYIILFTISFILGASSRIMSLVSYWGVRAAEDPNYSQALLRLYQAHTAFFVVLTVSACTGLILGWIKLARRPEAKQGVTGWIPVLMICLMGYALYNCINTFLTIYSTARTDPAAYLAGRAIAMLFFFGAYFSIFMISRGKGWDWLDPNGPRDYDMTHAHTQPVGVNNVYDPQLPQEAKRQSSMSYPQSPTPAPPYAGAYSGHGVYDQQQQQGSIYNTGTWGSGGYAPVHQTSYNAPPGAASRDETEHELLGRR